MTKITIDTREYWLSHGEEPRGYGHWAFWFGRRDFELGFRSAWYAEGWYADAKKKAIAEAKRRGKLDIFVAP